MKYILLTLFSLFLLSCSQVNYGNKVPLERAKEIKQVLNDKIDQEGYIEHGVNLMYRHGFYIYALSAHGILDNNDVVRFCNQANILKFYNPNGMISTNEPGVEFRIMTRDDYFGTLLGAYYGCKVSQCACDLLEWLWNDGKLMKLENDIWWFTHSVAFERAFTKEYYIHYETWDMQEYTDGLRTCRTKYSDVSSKLLKMVRIMIALDTKTSTIQNNKLYKYCLSENNYDNLFMGYYQGFPLGELLKGTVQQYAK